ncbi:hypothetical protein ACFVZH_37285 [Streptomyces sp. NPDC059534]|uniref:hypothetical protein n=1 Tax=Streptomyces sp. NPDC059534 TaxID=3346859 RepID=UPI003681678D
MYVGRPEGLVRKQQQAAAIAAEIAALMTQIESLGIGPCLPVQGRIAGPSFDIRRTERGWTARA